MDEIDVFRRRQGLYSFNEKNAVFEVPDHF